MMVFITCLVLGSFNPSEKYDGVLGPVGMMMTYSQCHMLHVWSTNICPKITQLPSGELTKSNGKWPFIVDFPIKNGDFPLLC